MGTWPYGGHHSDADTCIITSGKEASYWAHLLAGHTRLNLQQEHWKRSTEKASCQSLLPQQGFSMVKTLKNYFILKHFGLNSTLWHTSIDKGWLPSRPGLQRVSSEKNVSLDSAMESHAAHSSPRITRESLINGICLQLLQSYHFYTLGKVHLCVFTATYIKSNKRN